VAAPAGRSLTWPPWWFSIAAVVTFIVVGIVLGVMVSYVISAHGEIESLRAQLCTYQQAEVRIITALNARARYTLPIPATPACPPR
jgi:hypothetical protein